MSLPPDLQQAVAAEPRRAKHRVVSLDTRAGRLVIKGQRPRRSAWRYKVLNGIAGVLRMPLLKAAPAYGGARAQQVEVARLRSLAAAGVPVAPLLHVGEDHIVLQHLGGRPLDELIRRDPAAGLAHWRAGLQALAEVHRRGSYLSQAFARNMLVHEGRVFFIDFEDDPLEVMPLREAQLRDWLAYLQSTLWLLQAPQQELQAAWREQLGELPPELPPLLLQAARRLAWLRRLPRARRPWGRDVVALQALGRFLHTWARAGR